MILLPAINAVFARGVTAAMLESVNKGTAALLMVPTSPLGIEIDFYAKFLFCFLFCFVLVKQLAHSLRE